MRSARLQCEEIWSFCYAKQKNVAAAKKAPAEAGDVWTWTAIDADTKLIVSYFVGDRSSESDMTLTDDMRARIASERVQISTDGLSSYASAIEEAFGADVDYATMEQTYKTDPAAAAGRYSPPVCTSVRKRRVSGNPDIKHVSTSCVERQNLTMRMSMRRYTRLTNGFYKTFDNHCRMVALYTTWYNLIRMHKTLRCRPRWRPAAPIICGTRKTLLPGSMPTRRR